MMAQRTGPAPAAGASEVPEFAPQRLDVADTESIRASLVEHGYACIKDVASEVELETARDLLWDHLEGRDSPRMRQGRPVGWKRGQPTTWVEGHGDGLMTSGSHCSAMWHIRCLPGVVKAFEVAYGEPAVAAFDRLSVNLPISSGNPAALRAAETTFKHGKLRANTLHTHFNQDGYGPDEPICYAIFNLWDMDKAGGATSIVPGSHKPDKVKAINELRAAQYSGVGRDRKWVGPGREEEFIEAFTANGLQPVVLKNRAVRLYFASAVRLCGPHQLAMSRSTGRSRSLRHGYVPRWMSRGGPYRSLEPWPERTLTSDLHPFYDPSASPRALPRGSSGSPTRLRA